MLPAHAHVCPQAAPLRVTHASMASAVHPVAALIPATRSAHPKPRSFFLNRLLALPSLLLFFPFAFLFQTHPPFPFLPFPFPFLPPNLIHSPPSPIRYHGATAEATQQSTTAVRAAESSPHNVLQTSSCRLQGLDLTPYQRQLDHTSLGLGSSPTGHEGPQIRIVYPFRGS